MQLVLNRVGLPVAYGLSLTLAFVAPGLVASGQDTKKSTAGGTSKAAAASGEGAGASSPERPLHLEPLIWAEAHRDRLMRNTFRELSGPPVTNEQQATILEMARGNVGTDPALIKRYIDFYAAELSRRNNISAVTGEGIDPNKPRTNEEIRRARALDDAVGKLLAPLTISGTGGSRAFRAAYINELKKVGAQLLDGHLLTRSSFMIVVSRAGAPELVPLIAASIADPQQAHSVKMLGAIGLIEATQGGRRDLNPNTESIPAAEAINDFLQSGEEIPWPVQARCLEALGVMRQSTADPSGSGAEFADGAFFVLSDPDADPIARGWAAWALSRLNYPGLGGSPNLELIAYLMGQAAVKVGESIASIPIPAASPTKNLKLAARRTEPLVRMLDAFEGDPNLRGSGFNRIAAGSNAMRGVEQRIRALATAAMQFSQSAGAQVPEARRAVEGATAELRSYLQSNPPKNFELYPNGPKFAVAAASEGGARGADTPKSGSRTGR